jgi:hypothetical protein
MSALSDKARGGEHETGGANSVLITRDEMNTKYWQMLVT